MIQSRGQFLAFTGGAEPTWLDQPATDALQANGFRFSCSA
jgi:hypothetical protein